MVAADSTSVIATVRSALANAMARRDRTAMALYRTVLSAIANAAAVPMGDQCRPGAIESSALGVGVTEADRRQLSRDDEIAILEQELRDRRAAADSLAGTRPETARQLRSDAELLQELLDGLAADD